MNDDICAAYEEFLQEQVMEEMRRSWPTGGWIIIIFISEDRWGEEVSFVFLIDAIVTATGISDGQPKEPKQAFPLRIQFSHYIFL